MSTKKIIEELRKIQSMIEGDNFTWENINDLIKKLEVKIKKKNIHDLIKKLEVKIKK